MQGGSRAFLSVSPRSLTTESLVVDRKMSPVLQEARVDILDLNLCNSTLLYRGRIRSTNVCAGYPEGNIDTCQVTVLGMPRPVWPPPFWIPQLHALRGPDLVTLFLVACLRSQ